MPRGDGTGPMGLGPMTGRGMGYCAGYPVPGFMNPVPGFGFWRYRQIGFRRPPGMGGRGRGYMNMFYATGLPGWARLGWTYPRVIQPVQRFPIQPIISKEQEIQLLEQEINALEEEKKSLEQELESIRQRLNELRK